MAKKNNYTFEEREKILYMLKKGYTAREIANCTGRTKEAIKKEIQRIKKRLENVKEIEKQANLKKRDRKEALRALNSEVNSFISNSALIDKNRQHYKTSKKGDLVLKKGGYLYTDDMPKRYTNEEGRKWRNAIKHKKKL